MKKLLSLGTCSIPVTLRCRHIRDPTQLTDGMNTCARFIRAVWLQQEDPLVLNEYREDLRVECEKFGAVKKVILFDVSSLV